MGFIKKIKNNVSSAVDSVGDVLSSAESEIRGGLSSAESEIRGGVSDLISGSKDAVRDVTGYDSLNQLAFNTAVGGIVGGPTGALLGAAGGSSYNPLMDLLGGIGEQPQSQIGAPTGGLFGSGGDTGAANLPFGTRGGFQQQQQNMGNQALISPGGFRAGAGVPSSSQLLAGNPEAFLFKNQPATT